MSKLIIFRGYPGVGKTTLGRMLQAEGEGVFLDHNALVNTIISMTGNDDGVYEEIHALELAIAKKLLSEDKAVIVARGFSKVNTLQKYVDLAESTNAKCVVIRLVADIDTLSLRIHGKDRIGDWRPIATEDDLEKWITNNPMEAYPKEIIIDQTKSTHRVLKEIKRKI